MSKTFTLFALAALVVSDALLKSYIKDFFEPSVTAILFSSSLIILLLASIWLLQHLKVHEQDSFEATNASKAEILIVAGLLLAGISLRFWRLDSLYDGLWFDEAYKGLDAILIREKGETPIFLNWNVPREPLVAYLIAAFSHFAGYTIFSIRAVEAFAGSLTLLFFYLFVRTIFHRHVALLSLFLLVFSKYHLIFSRFGFRVNLILLFQSAALFLLAKAFQSNRRKWLYFIFAGILLGTGFYTYIAYRIFPVVILLFLMDPGVKGKVKKNWKPLVAGVGFCALIIAPLVLFFAQNPGSFTYRMNQVAVWSQGDESAVLQTAKSAVRSVAMFTYQGDPRQRHDVNREPALSPFTTAFFILGCLLAARNLKRNYALFLISYLLIALLPGILSIDTPHFPRSLGTLLPALILSAMGMISAYRVIAAGSVRAAKLLAIVVLMGVSFTGINDALFRYSYLLDTPYRFSSGMSRVETDAAKLVNQLGNRCRIYLSPQLFFHASVEFLTYPDSKQELFTPQTAFNKDGVAVVLLVTRDRDLWWLRDDDGKNYFHWWTKERNLRVDEIRVLAGTTYPLDGSAPQTDNSLLELLKERYPAGKILEPGPFTVFLVEGISHR